MHRRRLAHAVALAALAAFGCATAPTATQADWGPAQTLAAPPAEQLAATGNTGRSQLFAWKVTTGRRVTTRTWTGPASFVRARLRSSDGSLGAARAISSANELVADPAVALDRAGNATVVWTQAGRSIRVMGAHRRAGGSFGKPFEIGRTTAFNSARPVLGVASDGAVVVVWNGGERIRLARRGGGRCAGGRRSGCFDIRHDAPILAAVRARVGTIAGPHVVSAIPGSNPPARTNRQGEAIVVWNQRNPTPQNPDGPEVAASVRPLGAPGFQAPVRLSPAGIAADLASLAVDADGSAFAVYSAARPGQSAAPPAVVAHRRPAGTAFGPPELLGADFTGTFVFSAGSRVTAVSAGSGERTLISDHVPG